MLKSTFIVVTVVAAVAVAIGLAGRLASSVEPAALKPFNMDDLTIPAEQLLSGMDQSPAVRARQAKKLTMGETPRPTQKRSEVSFALSRFHVEQF